MFNMTSYETYVFLLCLIVFIALTALFTVMVVCILRLIIKLTKSGLEDERIRKEHEKAKRGKKAADFVDKLLTAVICAGMFLVFGFSVYMQIFADSVNTDIPLYRVVLSDSMSQKYEKNKYLFENNLNDQFDAFDLILTHKLPDEFDLKLYDIVVYEVDDTLVVHRIVQIEEPNEKHPNERHFRLQGDNVHIADKFPVKYSQMKAIYKGEKIPFVGSFIAFLQSPAGYLCILLVLFGVITIPLMDKRIEKEEKARLQFLDEQETTMVATEEEQRKGAMCTVGSHRNCRYCYADEAETTKIRISLEYHYGEPPALPKPKADEKGESVPPCKWLRLPTTPPPQVEEVKNEKEKPCKWLKRK